MFSTQEFTTVAKIKKGDTVEVVTGENKGARGQVQRMSGKDSRVVVAGVNIVTKHQKPRQAGRGQVRAGKIEFEAPIHVSNVMLVCPKCSKPTRVGYFINESGVKTRICKECQSEIA
jgi:large subunit ribosomal protein L24